jgi:hypothetical protein
MPETVVVDPSGDPGSRSSTTKGTKRKKSKATKTSK